MREIERKKKRGERKRALKESISKELPHSNGKREVKYLSRSKNSLLCSTLTEEAEPVDNESNCDESKRNKMKEMKMM